MNKETNNYGQTLSNQDSDYSYNYFNKESQMASTTGNYTGVYDMSGCAWEYVMGVKSSTESFDLVISNADKKYYDLYIFSTSGIFYNARILGDATGELGPFSTMSYGSNSENISSWYLDAAYFAFSSSLTTSYFVRGGQFSRGTGSGIFAFSSLIGYDDQNTTAGSYRLVLAPTN